MRHTSGEMARGTLKCAADVRLAAIYRMHSLEREFGHSMRTDAVVKDVGRASDSAGIENPRQRSAAPLARELL